MTLTPFPRPFFKTYAIAGVCTGLCVAFILTVFQPFGTSSFQHDYKFLILSGYGIVIAASILLYYFLSVDVLHKRRQDSWTIVHEVIDYLVCVLFTMSMTYLYFIGVFGHSFSGRGLFGFLKVASAVNLLPMIGLTTYMYTQYRGVVRSDITISEKDIEADQNIELTLNGVNKDESVSSTSDNILYIKAEDNYVIIHLREAEYKIGKHMIRSTMKDLLAQLPQHQFYQCHRSYIVNINRATALNGNKNSSSLSLRDCEKKVPVARSKYDYLKSSLAK